MARNFDGAADYGLISADTSLDDLWNNGGTCMIWTNPDSSDADDKGRYFNKYGSSGTEQPSHWYFNIRDESAGSSKLRFVKSFSTQAGAWTTSSTEVANDVYSHLLVSYDDTDTGNTPSIYVNASSVTLSATLSPSGTAGNDTGECYFAARNSSNFGVDGDCAYGVWWSTTLTDNQITALSNGVNPFAIQNDSIVLFNPLYGNESPEGDYSGNNNTMALTSAPPKSASPPVELLENYM